MAFPIPAGSCLHLNQLNLQGDVIGITDESGNVIAHYTYDAWGNPLEEYGSAQNVWINPLRYRGYVYDSTTGLYYAGSRYYDPQTGRFIYVKKKGRCHMKKNRVWRVHVS